MSYNKAVFVSYSHKDGETALKIAAEIENTLGKEVWIDLFDLDAGDEFALKIAGAIQKANWFIFIASKDSYKSKWVRFEANIATFQSIEKEDFKIITVKIDDEPFPEHLKPILQTRIYLNAVGKIDETIKEIPALIKKQPSTRSGLVHLFFDRGREIDLLQIAIDKAKAIFLIGPYGIGKTTLIDEAIKNRIGAPYYRISIRKGHDLEILCRQIIALNELEQPEKDADINSIVTIAFETICKKQQTERSYLVIDELENAFDEEGGIRKYLIEFIRGYILKGCPLSLILLSNRKPELPFDILGNSQFILVDRLPEEFISPLIKHWYRNGKGEDLNVLQLDLDAISKNLSGHPLAARLIASYMILYSAHSIIKNEFMYGFKIRIAEYILKDLVKELNEIDKTILQTIAVAELGLSIEDLMQLKCCKDLKLESIQSIVNKLTNAMIISQDADLLKLHPFVQEFFLRDAEINKDFKAIANDIGNRLFYKYNGISLQIQKLGRDTSPKELPFLNKKLFQYAVASHRLLLFSGQIERAGKIPFNLRGHIREMVFMSYQRFKDYREALEYANKWLEIDPSDHEVALFKARSLRRLGKYSEAEELLKVIGNTPDKYMRAKVDRERGIIAKDNNRDDDAIKFFRKACVRNNSGVPVYAIAMADLANILVIQADGMEYDGSDDEKIKNNCEEAIKLLNEAKEYLTRFEESNLSYYIDALIHLGKWKEAEEKLEYSIRNNPNDAHLFLKKARLLINNSARMSEAIECADVAIKKNIDWGYMIKARILFNNKNYEEAQKVLEFYKPKSPRDNIYFIELKSRILMARDKFDEVREIIKAGGINNNRFIDFIRMQNELRHAQKEINTQNYQAAKTLVSNASKYYDSFIKKYRNNLAVQHIHDEIINTSEVVGKMV